MRIFPTSRIEVGFGPGRLDARISVATEAEMYLKKQQLPHLRQQRDRWIREAAQAMIVAKIQQAGPFSVL